jgi:tight adherence protein C
MTLADFLPARFGTEAALELAIAAASFVTVLALLRAAMPHDRTAARARSHLKRRQQLRAALLTPSRRGRDNSIGLIRRILERLNLTRGEESRGSAELLAQAGLRGRDALFVYLGARLCLPLVLGATSFFVALAVVTEISNLNRLLVGIFGAIVGAYSPTLMLRRLIAVRRRKLQKALPDTLDLLVICAEAGLSLDAALTRVAREMAQSAPEMADEIGLTAIELGFLPNRRDALVNLTRRVDQPAIRGVVNTLVQTERYGTPLANSLRVLAAEFRDARMLRAEEKAARLPATLTVPMILFIMPALFIVLIGPAIIQVLRTFGR